MKIISANACNSVSMMRCMLNCHQTFVLYAPHDFNFITVVKQQPAPAVPSFLQKYKGPDYEKLPKNCIYQAG